MADVKRSDVELYRGLEPVLGPDVTTMLLERLPPRDEELATRRDVEALRGDLERLEERLEERLDLRFAAHSAELKGFVHEVVGGAIQTQTRTILVGMAGILFSATALATALGQLL